MSIPKKIHYCWFGRGPKPELALRCIETWKKYCPDYEIIEWNENNFDVSILPFTEEAYGSKKYAFVTDYVRLYAMYYYGGIYMDTDVEVTRNLDDLMGQRAFSGFEAPDRVSTGIMAAEKGFPLLKELMDYYNDRHFINDAGEMDMTTNVVIISNILTRHGLNLNGQYQIVDGFAIYPQDYFCPKDISTLDIHMTENTYAIHHFNGSWLSPEKKKEMEEYRRITGIFGISTGERLILARRILRDQGIFALIRRIVSHFVR